MYSFCCRHRANRPIEEIKNRKAVRVHFRYSSASYDLKLAFSEACVSQDIEYPKYYPGRHWLTELKNMWMQLFPATDSESYHKVCEDLLTLLRLDVFFSDYESTNIKELVECLLDNYEMVCNTSARLAKNMNQPDDVIDQILGGKMKETPEEDGSYVWYFGSKPVFILLGDQEETEQQKEWRELDGCYLAHIPRHPCLNPDESETSDVSIEEINKFFKFSNRLVNYEIYFFNYSFLVRNHQEGRKKLTDNGYISE